MREGDDELGGHFRRSGAPGILSEYGFGNGIRFMMCQPSQPYMCYHVTPLWDVALLSTLVGVSKEPHY